MAKRMQLIVSAALSLLRSFSSSLNRHFVTKVNHAMSGFLERPFPRWCVRKAHESTRLFPSYFTSSDLLPGFLILLQGPAAWKSYSSGIGQYLNVLVLDLVLTISFGEISMYNLNVLIPFRYTLQNL